MSLYPTKLKPAQMPPTAGTPGAGWHLPRWRRYARILRHPAKIIQSLRDDRRARAHYRTFPPVFIVGAPRSGTTLLLQILAAQPSCTADFEPFRIWEQVVGRRPDDTIAGPLTLGQRVKLRTEFFRQIEPGRPVLIVKDPRDSLRINAIRRVFPTARFIHIVRDGRDVIASIIRAFETGGTYLVEPGWAHVRFPGYRRMFHDPHHLKAAHMWRICVETVAREFGHMPPECRITVRYEDLLQAPEHEARRVVAFAVPGFSHTALQAVLPLISNTVPLTAQETAAPDGFEKKWVKSAVALDAGSGTFSTSVRTGKWRDELPEQVQRECEPVIAQAMALFGYTVHQNETSHTAEGSP
jgi:hypothetical protein